LDQGEYIFLGRVDLDVFNDVMGTDIATENADTIGGFIYGEIGDVPSGGEVLEAGGVTLVVEEVVGRRITKVRAKREIMDDHKKDGDSDER
jgi:putative hemolysin